MRNIEDNRAAFLKHLENYGRPGQLFIHPDDYTDVLFDMGWTEEEITDHFFELVDNENA